MDKITILKDIMNEKGYNEIEVNFILKHLCKEWLSIPQTREEIEKALYCSYGIWRGLGNALANVLEAEKRLRWG